LVKLQLIKANKKHYQTDRIRVPVFNDQEQAEAHGPELCKEWMDKLMGVSGGDEGVKFSTISVRFGTCLCSPLNLA